MSRRIWTGILAGVLAGMVVVAVGIGAFRAGQHRDAVTRAVSDGEVVRVVDGHGWGFGPGPGFLLFPLLVFGLVFLLARGLGGGARGWHREYGPGPCGPGGPEAAFRDWHRREHADETKEASSERVTNSGAPDRAG